MQCRPRRAACGGEAASHWPAAHDLRRGMPQRRPHCSSEAYSRLAPITNLCALDHSTNPSVDDSRLLTLPHSDSSIVPPRLSTPLVIASVVSSSIALPSHHCAFPQPIRTPPPATSSPLQPTHTGPVAAPHSFSLIFATARPPPRSQTKHHQPPCDDLPPCPCPPHATVKPSTFPPRIQRPRNTPHK